MCVRAPHGAQSEHTGHNEHADHSVEMFRQKFWGTLLLSIPTLVWAPMMQHWFGYTPPGGATASRWIPAFFGSLVFAYGGWVPLERPWRFSSVRHQHASRIAATRLTLIVLI
jgi:Cu2+-exporting ATPase